MRRGIGRRGDRTLTRHNILNHFNCPLRNRGHDLSVAVRQAARANRSVRMYSLVMMAALTAGPDVPQHWMCPVTPSNYGCGFWSNHCFYECCAPARYGWVNCWNKGFSYYPGGGRGFCGDCTATYGNFYYPPTCSCAPCGGSSASPGGGNFDHNWCGYGWPIGDQPAYYTSVLGCTPHVTAPPYAYYTERDPCCKFGQFAFDSGLIGHSQGVGYAGFGGFGNFGFYGGVSMTHPATTADLPHSRDPICAPHPRCRPSRRRCHRFQADPPRPCLPRRRAARRRKIRKANRRRAKKSERNWHQPRLCCRSPRAHG